MGQPKALVRDDHDVPLLDRAVDALPPAAATRSSSSSARRPTGRALLDEAGSTDARRSRGRGRRLGGGHGRLAATRSRGAAAEHADAAVVTLVDLPDVGRTSSNASSAR